jgi:hypothetical protein
MVLSLGLTPLPEGITEESPMAHCLLPWVPFAFALEPACPPCGHRRLRVEFLTAPVCAYILLAMACLAALDIAAVASRFGFSGEYFATVVIGLLSCGCFAAESGGWSPCGCSAAVGVFASSLVDAWPSVESLAYALPSLPLRSPLW